MHLELFNYLAKTSYKAEKKIEMIKELSNAAGPEGMVYGQIMDMTYPINFIEELDKMHFLKTGKMIILPIKLALIIADIPKNSSIYKDFLEYGKNLGIAFQARDDLLDVIGSEETVGKRLNKDFLQNKKTYIDFWGIEGTQKKIDELVDTAIYSIRKYNHKSLENLADFLRKRDY
jgi:geranylgeranyl diphosphate synthase type II